MKQLRSHRLGSHGTTNAERQVWINGNLLDATLARISPYDHGFLTGDGVFETLKVYQGRVFEYDRHYNRMLQAAKRFGLVVPPTETFKQAIAEVLEANGLEHADCRLRLTITAGDAPLGCEKEPLSRETIVVASGELPNHPPMAPVVTVPYPRNERAALVGIKTTSYGENVVALTYAKERGANDAIFANTKGNLCEGTGSNIFLVMEGQLITPPLSAGCLPGVTRAVVLELCEKAGISVKEIDVPIERLFTCDEAFLTSSLREIMPITKVNETPLPCPGPISSRVREMFFEYVGNV